MGEFMKESGMITLNTGKDMKSLATVQSIKEATLEENLKAMEDTNGRMENFMKVNGWTDSNMVQVFGEEERETRILGSGEKERLMGMEFTPGSMEIAMKDNSKIVSNMEKELNTFLMETLTKGTISVESLQGSDNIIGSQEVFLKDSLRLDWEMVKVFGKKELAEVRSMKDIG